MCTLKYRPENKEKNTIVAIKSEPTDDRKVKNMKGSK